MFGKRDRFLNQKHWKNLDQFCVSQNWHTCMHAYMIHIFSMIVPNSSIASSSRRSRSDSDVKTLSPDVSNEMAVSSPPPEKPPNDKEVLEVINITVLIILIISYG